MLTRTELRRHIAGLPHRSFLHTADLPASPSDIKEIVDRLTAERVLHHVAPDLYYRPGPADPTLPGPLEIGLAAAGVGAGPAGPTAARTLGIPGRRTLTVIAAPAPAPQPLPHTVFIARPAARRAHSHTAADIALIETLGWLGPDLDDGHITQLAAAVRHLARTGTLNLTKVAATIADEPSPASQTAWQQLAAQLPPADRTP